MDKATLEKLDDNDWNTLSVRKLFPLSVHSLLKLGQCCGNKCENCPYEPKHIIGNKNINILFDYKTSNTDK